MSTKITNSKRRTCDYGDFSDWKDLSNRCKKRDGWKCTKCGFSPDKDERHLLHADHIVPLSKGGRNVLSNLQTLCYKCHEKKTNMLRSSNIKVEYNKKSKKFTRTSMNNKHKITKYKTKTRFR